MFTDNDWKSRFTPLHFNEAELQTEEVASKITYNDHENKKTSNEAGLLHIGSKSIVFEPRKDTLPMLKYLLKNIKGSLHG